MKIELCRVEVLDALLNVPSTWNRAHLVRFVSDELAARYEKCSDEELVAELINALATTTAKIAREEN